MTLACADGNSKLVEVVTVVDVDVDDENCVGNNLLQIWTLRFGHKAILMLTFSTRFSQKFEVEVQARF